MGMVLEGPVLSSLGTAGGPACYRAHAAVPRKVAQGWAACWHTCPALARILEVTAVLQDHVAAVPSRRPTSSLPRHTIHAVLAVGPPSFLFLHFVELEKRYCFSL